MTCIIKKNISYVEEKKEPSTYPQQQTLDIFLPLTLSSSQSSSRVNNRPPVIIVIHGGAWRSGDKSELESFCEKLTEISNYVVVNVNYRLTIANVSPDVKHPAHIEDVAKAIYWVYQNSDKFGYNND